MRCTGTFASRSLVDVPESTEGIEYLGYTLHAAMRRSCLKALCASAVRLLHNPFAARTYGEEGPIIGAPRR